MPISMLSVEPELVQAWNDANNDENEEFIHTIKIKVEKEKISLDGSPKAIAVESRDTFSQWDVLKEDVQMKDSPEASAPTPHLWLTRADLVPESPNHTKYKWALVTYVPETGVHPRSKMMYASARGIIRQKLTNDSPNLFAPDYHVTDVADLSETAYKGWLHHDSRDAMSNREIERAEVEKEITKERATLPFRMPLMRVPFKMSQELDAEIQSLAEAQKACVGTEETTFPSFWVEVKIDDTSAGASPTSSGNTDGVLVKKYTPASKDDFSKQILSIADEPRLYLVHLEVEEEHADQKGHVFLLYHCPVMSKPKDRMKYSTAKKGLSDAVAAAGLKLYKAVRDLHLCSY